MDQFDAKFCSNCGVAIEPKYRFCPSCGAGRPGVAKSSSDAAVRKPKKLLWIVPPIVAIVLLTWIWPYVESATVKNTLEQNPAAASALQFVQTDLLRNPSVLRIGRVIVAEKGSDGEWLFEVEARYQTDLGIVETGILRCRAKPTDPGQWIVEVHRR